MKNETGITEEEYQAFLKKKPEERVSPSGDLIHDKIVGILIAFNTRCKMRGQWIDLITVSDAEKEIKQLINDYSKGNIGNPNCEGSGDLIALISKQSRSNMPQIVTPNGFCRACSDPLSSEEDGIMVGGEQYCDTVCYQYLAQKKSRTKEAHEYWYYFGSCMPYPHQIAKGTLPRKPYKRFDSKEECQYYIDSKRQG